MSELLENLSLEDLVTPTVEQESTTFSLPDLDLSLDKDLDFDMTDFPADLSSDIPDIGFSTPSVDLSVSSDSDLNFDSNFNIDPNFDTDLDLSNSGLGFNSFDSNNTNQFAAPPPMMTPMYAPQYPSFGYQPPPGYMLVPVIYGQQPMMPIMPMMQPPMQMPIQTPSFSFAPTPDAPVFPSFDDLSSFDNFSSFDDLSSSFDEPEPMSAVSAPTSTPTPTPSRTSRRIAGQKTTYKDPSTPTVPTKRQKASRPKPERPTFELAAPISVLTDGSDIPIKDMLAFVNRSAAVRRDEAAKAGKVSRSLNSFVCYRAGYADRIKQWAGKDNHQNVSIIAGSSWKIEPDNIRSFYINCAEIDKFHHIEAFPDYKYAPTKKPARSDSPDIDDDDEPTPRPNKRRHITPLFSDDEDDHIFVSSAAPTPSKYNLRRRH